MNDINISKTPNSELARAVVFDLDGTICYLNPDNKDYRNCIPYPQAIQTINDLRKKGIRVILQTARHMRSKSANEGEILADLGYLYNWLDKWNLTFDEIRLGKPHADIFIDDKGYRHTSWESTRQFLDQLYSIGTLNDTNNNMNISSDRESYFDRNNFKFFIDSADMQSISTIYHGLIHEYGIALPHNLLGVTTNPKSMSSKSSLNEFVNTIRDISNMLHTVEDGRTRIIYIQIPYSLYYSTKELNTWMRFIETIESSCLHPGIKIGFKLVSVGTFDLQKATCIPPYLKGFPLNLTGVADMSVAHKYAGNGHLNHVSIIPGRIGSRGNMNVGIGHVIYLHNLFEERDIQLPPLDKSKIIVGSLRTDRDIALSSYLGFIPTIGKTAYNSIVTEYATDNGNKSVFESINLNQVIQTYSGMVNSHRSFLRSPTQLLSEKTEMANITNEFILEMEKFVNDSGWFGEFQHLLSYDNSLFFSTLV